METKLVVNVPVDVAIEVLKDAEGLMESQYKELEDKCGLRHMSSRPITADEAIDVIYNQYDANGGTLRQSQAESLYHVLEDNPLTFAELADHCWEDKDTAAFLKARFTNKGYTSKEDLLRNVAEFLELNF